MLKGGDDKWRTMANEKVYRSKMLIGALYRGELAGELRQLGYGIEKTHADGRFEIEGVSRDAIEAFSTRRAAIVAAMEERGLGGPDTNPRQRFLARNAGVGEGRLTRKGARDMGKVPARLQGQARPEPGGYEPALCPLRGGDSASVWPGIRSPVPPTKSDTNATVEYLDGSDTAIADADMPAVDAGQLAGWNGRPAPRGCGRRRRAARGAAEGASPEPERSGGRGTRRSTIATAQGAGWAHPNEIMLLCQ